MKKIFFAIAALATMSANAQVVKIFQNTDSQPVTFRNPSSVLFCTDAEDVEYNPEDSKEDASLYGATPYFLPEICCPIRRRPTWLET